jgi:hypothetical protein
MDIRNERWFKERVAWHEEEGAEADRKDRQWRKVTVARFGAEIAKQKPMWEKSPSAPECETVLEQSAKIL